MSTVLPPKPTPQCVSKNKKRLFLILLAAAAIMLTAFSMGTAYKMWSSLRSDMIEAQLLLSRHQEHLQYMNQRLNNNEAHIFAKQEQAWEIKARTHGHGERINRLEQALAQSLHSDANSKIREQNLIKELKTLKDMYLQSQQKLNSYEQHLLALTQEIKANREQNQLVRQEQAKMRAEHQELIKRLYQTPQVSQEALEKALESRMSQFVYNDYEHEQKLKDLQKAVESCAKVGELKAIEVYYDDKIDSLHQVLQSTPKSLGGKNKVDVVSPQIKQELAKLNIEKEEIKVAMNNLWDHQRKSEERINALEVQGSRDNKQPEVKKAQPEIIKNDLKVKDKQPKNVKQTRQNEEESEPTGNLFELLQKMINEHSDAQAQEPNYHPYMNYMNAKPQRHQEHNFNRNSRPSMNQHPRGFNHGVGNLFHYL